MSVKASSTILAVSKVEIERYKTSILNHCEEYIDVSNEGCSSLTSCRISTDARESRQKIIAKACHTPNDHAGQPLKPAHKRHGQRIPHLCRYIYIKKSLTCRLFYLSRLRWLIHKARHLIDHEAWHLSFPHSGAQRRLKLSLFP